MQKKMIIRDMTVTEISTVDTPAQKGAVAVIIKSASADAAIRKNAAAVSEGEAAPVHTVVEYEEAMLRRAAELAKERGVTPERALAEGLTTDDTLRALSRAVYAARHVQARVEIAKRNAAVEALRT